MLNSEKIIEGIRDDAPAVYDILLEIFHHPYAVPYEKDRTDAPTADQLLEVLTEYDGDNYDVHYWSGRYAQMIEEDSKTRTPIRVPFTESDLYDLLSWEITFHWEYEWVPLFIFNTDCSPELDPDSEDYDPSISI